MPFQAHIALICATLVLREALGLLKEKEQMMNHNHCTECEYSGEEVNASYIVRWVKPNGMTYTEPVCDTHLEIVSEDATVSHVVLITAQMAQAA